MSKENKSKPLEKMSIDEIVSTIEELRDKRDKLWAHDTPYEEKMKMADELREQEAMYLGELTQRYRELMTKLEKQGFASDYVTVTITDISEINRIRNDRYLRPDPMFRITVLHPTRNTYVSNTLSERESLKFIEWINTIGETFKQAVELLQILNRFGISGYQLRMDI